MVRYNEPSVLVGMLVSRRSLMQVRKFWVICNRTLDCKRTLKLLKSYLGCPLLTEHLARTTILVDGPGPEQLGLILCNLRSGLPGEVIPIGAITLIYR